MSFADVLGHERVKGLLGAAIERGHLPPALLFLGPPGVGKRTLALEVARALLCEKPAGGACGACSACRRSFKGAHPDLLLVEAETAAIKIEQVRGLVREILGRPFEARARAFVVDEAHLMTEQAANALLKSLEEPPATSHVMLVTASPQTLLPTIRSRCQAVRLGPLPLPELEAHFRERLGLGGEEARLRASLSGGSLGAALAFESDAYRALRDQLLQMLERTAGLGVMERMEAAEGLAELEDLPLALVTLRSLIRDAAALRAGALPAALLNADVATRLHPLGQGPVGQRAVGLGHAIGETQVALKANANRLLAMDVLMDALAGPAPAR